jgi:triosephosphate isomerase
MRTPLIAGNWKLHKTIAESLAMVDELKPLVAGSRGVEIVVAPVFTALKSVSFALSGSGIGLAAQDCFWEEQGAFTGEVSPALLRDAGCSHVIVGHSERRQFFGETDEGVNRKARAAMAAGLTVIICVGETLEERESRATFTVVGRQVTAALAGFPPHEFSRIVIAYEPVWAIGTGKTATDQQAQEVHCYIRNLVTMSIGQAIADSLRIIYGGSVKPDNIRGLMAQPDIDGALIGGASLKAASFADMVNFRG